jgi:DNA-binding MarR family transcriptional regulator
MKKSKHDIDPIGVHHSGTETHLLKELMLTHVAILNSVPKLTGMSYARLGLLRTIAVSYPEVLGPMEIARRLGINAAAITRQLNEMEADGMISRVSDTKDARRSGVELTEQGRNAFSNLHERIHKFETSMRSSFSKEDIETTAKVLNHLRDVLTQHTKG